MDDVKRDLMYSLLDDLSELEEVLEELDTIAKTDKLDKQEVARKKEIERQILELNTRVRLLLEVRSNKDNEKDSKNE